MSLAFEISVPLLSNLETDLVVLLPLKLQTIFKFFQICLTELLPYPSRDFDISNSPC